VAFWIPKYIERTMDNLPKFTIEQPPRLAIFMLALRRLPETNSIAFESRRQLLLMTSPFKYAEMFDLHRCMTVYL
jgi:hypothetical protein